MFKFILSLVFITLLQASPATAYEDAVNIYNKPREVPSHHIIHESGKYYKLSDFKGNFVLALF